MRNITLTCYITSLLHIKTYNGKYNWPSYNVDQIYMHIVAKVECNSILATRRRLIFIVAFPLKNLTKISS